MQQTSKYQFKLIEGTDDFSPDPINDNMEQVETQLSNLDTNLTSQLEDMMGNLGSVGKNLRVIEGSYIGTGGSNANSPTRLTFSFRPVVLFIYCTSAPLITGPMILMRPVSMGTRLVGDNGAKPISVAWANKYVTWFTYSGGTAADQMNTENATYHYVALGC